MDNHDIFLWLLMLFDDDEAEQRPDVNIAPVAMFMAFHRRDSVPRVDNFAEVTVLMLNWPPNLCSNTATTLSSGYSTMAR